MSVSWAAPICIPVPDFGINETVEMYRLQKYDFGGTLADYRDAGNGPYSHYVDNSASNCLDGSEKSFGSQDLPRCSIPVVLEAGSVTVTHYDSPSANVARRAWFIFNEMYNAEEVANRNSYNTSRGITFLSKS
ncbi:MAG: hypothetical protein A2504_10435 [Bdellovibrionales bacterium RIFOXYD12_FULL_39_22]|nr:MAG: hypothetical protein A2385_17050 [Bdellovibrionales bacterium RIFOXYB1_FULL_39_21]OFZ44103.1 MAG: hypothetical protein A2485_14190 [Bdellovibrionales bacterium RIFOXYC12_FULL_39_17]OFZ48663.1 MAG: hypothetical protein A2404_08255 [Bdellovibrionales bacterium RIFOXYC1_FULL_39_130]OFZ70257.1 MAG: hypothetical protein A2451_11685 [Bdellovibrionales bacterium RIFOXYC2_FULL_39_8]OFZ76777.1 MAG: hypothetical protein A2560_10545 [Bdellovibrionales bacterium RIFOXYD1_FULL_39_84]OFZ95080.1 MAG: